VGSRKDCKNNKTLSNFDFFFTFVLPEGQEGSTKMVWELSAALSSQPLELLLGLDETFSNLDLHWREATMSDTQYGEDYPPPPPPSGTDEQDVLPKPKRQRRNAIRPNSIEAMMILEAGTIHNLSTVTIQSDSVQDQSYASASSSADSSSAEQGQEQEQEQDVASIVSQSGAATSASAASSSPTVPLPLPLTEEKRG